MTDERYRLPKSLLVKILQWFYLSLGLAVFGLPFIYQQQSYSKSLGFPIELIYGVTAILAIYCFVLFISFLTQNTNLLILSLVFIFFTTIGGLLLLALAFPNLGTVLSGNLPSCYNNLSACSLGDGIILASAAAVAVAGPLLLLNLITIIGAVKAIAAYD